MKKVAVVVLALALLLAAAPAILVVEATRPAAVSGTYFPVGPPTLSNLRDAGKSGNAFMDISLPTKMVGSIKGVGVEAMHWIMLNEDTPEERTIIHGVLTLTTDIAVFGVVKTGTLTIKMYMDTGDGVGLWRIIGGTGELASLHGEGALAIITPLPNVLVGYSGQVHFDS